jgi:hypothetical protein
MALRKSLTFPDRNVRYEQCRPHAAGLRFLVARVQSWASRRGNAFDRLEDAVNCVMQHAFARTEQVAWIKRWTAISIWIRSETLHGTLV